MTDKQYLERMSELTDQLQAAGNARPYNPDVYNRIIDELNALPARHIAKPESNWILRIINAPNKWWFAVSDRLKKILKDMVTP